MSQHVVRVDRSDNVVRVVSTATGVPGPTGPQGPVGPAGTPIPVSWGPTPPADPAEGDLWLQTLS